MEGFTLSMETSLKVDSLLTSANFAGFRVKFPNVLFWSHVCQLDVAQDLGTRFHYLLVVCKLLKKINADFCVRPKEFLLEQ